MEHYSFTERAAHETGFSELYDTKIAPFFRALDAKREETRNRHRRQTVVVAILTLLVCGAVMRAVHPLAVIYPVFFGGALTAVTYFRSSVPDVHDVQGFLRPLLCAFMGDMTYHPRPPTLFVPIERLQQLGVVPRAQDEHIAFGVEGTWLGEDYRLVAARFRERNTDETLGKGNYRTLFSGIVLEVDCPVNMPLTVFARDFGSAFNGLYKWAGGKHLPEHKLDLEDNTLEDIFEVYTTDSDTARQNIDTRFAETLTQIATRFQQNNGYLGAAFEGRKFYIALSRPRFFMGLDFGDRPFAESNDLLRNAMTDLLLPRQIIGALHGDQAV